MIKKYQQKFRKAKEETEGWSETQARLISQFNNASLIIERLPIIRKKENFGALNCVNEITDAVLSKQLQLLQSVLLSMGTILEEFRAVVLSLEKLLRDSGEFIRGGSSQLNTKQLQQRIGLKPSLADCLDGLKLLSDMHFAELQPIMTKKQSSQDATPQRICSSVGKIEIDPFEDTSWVVVKKQRVTILLPPQSVSEGCLVQDAGPSGALDGAADDRTLEGNVRPQGVSHLSDMSLREIEDSKKLGELSTLRIDRAVKSSSPFRKISRQSRARVPRASKNRVEPLNRKDAPAELTTPTGDSQLHTYAHSTAPPPNKIEASKEFDEYPTLGINTTIKTRRTCTSRNFHQGGIAGAPCVFADVPEPLSRQLRARNLKRKLEEAGGLVGWLLSMGLVQFVKIFEHKPMNEFHLASLTMLKLKEMGAAAVGPRRKLMHSLNCVSRPCPAALKHPTFHL